MNMDRFQPEPLPLEKPVLEYKPPVDPPEEPLSADALLRELHPMRARLDALIEILEDQSQPRTIGSGPFGALLRIEAGVASHFGLSIARLGAKDRSTHLVIPRYVITYIARGLNISKAMICDRFGWKDRHMVGVAIGRVREKMETEPEFKALVLRLEREVK